MWFMTDLLPEFIAGSMREAGFEPANSYKTRS